VKNKILLISLAVVLALSLGLIGCETVPVAPEAIVIGTARDTDEALAIFEAVAAGPTMRAFVKYVNDDLGGVHLSAYDADVPLEIDMREISVGEWDVGVVTQGICDDIDTGTVHYLWGGPGTDCIYTQAPIANAEATVLFTFEGGATAISNDIDKLAVWPYVFINLSYSDWYQLPVLAKMLEDKLEVGPGAAKAYVVHIQGEHGEEYLAVAEDNFDVVDDEEVPFDPSGLNADAVIENAMIALNATPYDIFCCFAYPDHNIALVGAAMAADFDPPAFVTGPGANFGFFGYVFSGNPGDIEGMLCFAVANFATSEPIADALMLIAAQMEEDGAAPPGQGPAYIDFWGHPCYWAACEMWLNVIEDAGDIGQELLREGLAATEDDPMTTILGDTWYRMFGTNGGGNMDYLCHTGEVGQWLFNVGANTTMIEVVGYEDITDDLPNYVVTGDFLFPMTGLWNWL
jgi:hypothetical protein